MRASPAPANVLVTGAAGLVGCQVALALSARGCQVAAVYRESYPRRLSGVDGITLYRADLRRPEALPGRYDALVHCAADVPALCPDEHELYDSNVEGTRALVRQAAAAGVERIVFCSSMAVYGAVEADVVDESTPLREPGAYGRSKLEGERLLADLVAAGLDLRGLSIRLPGVVGIGSRNNFLSDTLASILSGMGISARNPEAQFNNIVHVADLAEFIAHLVHQMPNGYTVSTIAADQPMTIGRVISTLFSEAGLPEQVTYSTGGRPFLVSPERARALGFAVPTVEDSLIRFVRENLAARTRGKARPRG